MEKAEQKENEKPFSNQVKVKKNEGSKYRTKNKVPTRLGWYIPVPRFKFVRRKDKDDF
jgi:hypothetical protein